MWGYWQAILLIRLHGVVVWKYEIVFNTKYFIINSKITALCSRNRLAVLAYIYIHTHAHTGSCLLESDNDRYTPVPIFEIAYTNTQSS